MNVEKILREQIKDRFSRIEEFLESSSACRRIPAYRELCCGEYFHHSGAWA